MPQKMIAVRPELYEKLKGLKIGDESFGSAIQRNLKKEEEADGNEDRKKI
mgnify:CR=1 FL=1